MSKRIMVIDNDKAMRDLFEFFLMNEGWEVFSYGYAQVGLAVVQRLMPDLIILDLDIGKAGWSLLQLFKMEDATALIPIVVCTTASTLSLEIEGYLATRQISIVRKPFDVEDVVSTINKSFIAAPILPILVVEDNEELSDTVTAILGLWGYLTVTAANGQVALDSVARTRHALILLDISMPVMTGLEFLAVYSQQAGPHSPVIIFTSQPDLMPEHLPEFVMDVLPKPFEPSQLIALVSKYAQPVWGGVEL